MEKCDYKRVILPQAESDIEETLDYIAEKLFNPTAAVKLMEDMEETMQSVSQFTDIHRACRICLLRPQCFCARGRGERGRARQDKRTRRLQVHGAGQERREQSRVVGLPSIQAYGRNGSKRL